MPTLEVARIAWLGDFLRISLCKSGFGFCATAILDGKVLEMVKEGLLSMENLVIS